MSKGREAPQQFLVQQQVSVETESIHTDIAPSLLLDIKQAQTIPVTDRRLQNQEVNIQTQLELEITSIKTPLVKKQVPIEIGNRHSLC